MHKLKGVILDVDGTLVDSNDQHTRAWLEAMAEYGHEVAFTEVRRLIGMSGSKLLPEAIGVEADSELGRKIDRRRGELFKERYLEQIVAFPKTRDLLLRMKEDGLDLVVASSAQEDELKSLLEKAGASDLISSKTSSDDAKRSKPAPDIVEAALKKLQADPSELLMLGDTPYDIGAANGADVACIAFRSGGWDDANLRGAVAIYDGPQDLLERYEASPLKTNL